MSRHYDIGNPERPLMAQISNLLGIEHFSTSNGGSVRRDFLEAVALAVGIDRTELASIRTKELLIERLVRLTTGDDFDKRVLSSGGTVTNEALALIAQGIQTMPRVRASLDRSARAGVAAAPLPEPVADVESLDPSEVPDLRRDRLTSIAVRDGQDGFRKGLLKAYDGRCAITEFDAVEALEAAHIYPYRGAHTNVASNGLLLRADIHTLFDRGQIAIHEDSLAVLFSDHLRTGTRYAELAATSPTLRVPASTTDRPSRTLLRAHREWTQLDHR